MFKNLYYNEITIEEAKRKQDKFNPIIGALEDCTLRNTKYIEAKNNEYLKQCKKKFTRGEKKLLKGFKTEYFHLIMMKRMRNE